MGYKRFKVITGITISVLALTVAFSYMIVEFFNSRDARQIEKDHQLFEKALQHQQQMIFDRLVESSYLLAENSTFKANVQLGDNQSLRFSASDFALFMKIDLFAVIGPNGELKYDLEDKFSARLTGKLASIKQALKGNDPPVDFQTADLLRFENSLYQIVAVPIFAGKNSVIGAVLMGVDFQKFIVKPLAELTRFSLFLSYKDKPVGIREHPLYIREHLTSDKKNTEIIETNGPDTHAFNYINSARSSEVVFKTKIGTYKDGEVVAVIPAEAVFESVNIWNSTALISAIAGFFILNIITVYIIYKTVGKTQAL